MKYKFVLVVACRVGEFADYGLCVDLVYGLALGLAQTFTIRQGL